MKIRCVVERITYQNPENGYTILKCRVKEYAELVPVIGLATSPATDRLWIGLMKARAESGNETLILYSDRKSKTGSQTACRKSKS